MPGRMTLLDLMKRANAAGADLVEEALVNAPEVRVLPAKSVPGTAVQLRVRQGLPNVAFRNLNEGTAASKSEYKTRTFEMPILDRYLEVDRRGLDGMSSAQIADILGDETVGALEAAFALCGAQMYYGVGNDAKGFPGLIAQASTEPTHLLNAGGAANKTSAWVLSAGPGKLEFLLGNNQTILLPSDDGWQEVTVTDASGGKFPAYGAWMTGRVGFRLANINAAIRIKNISTEPGKKFSADYLAQAFANMRDKRLEPTHIFMTGRTLLQWRDSRKTDQNPEPETPKEYEGVPVIQTASISNAETV